MPSNRYFTIEHAERALVYIRPILEQISVQYADFVKLQQSVVQDARGLDEPGREDTLESLKLMRDEIKDCVEEIHRTGAIVKDLNAGFCEFPYKRVSGDVVSLCFDLEHGSVYGWRVMDAETLEPQALKSLLEEERDAAKGQPA